MATAAVQASSAVRMAGLATGNIPSSSSLSTVASMLQAAGAFTGSSQFGQGANIIRFGEAVATRGPDLVAGVANGTTTISDANKIFNIISTAGSLTQNSNASIAGALGSIVTSADPMKTGAIAMANIATNGMFGKLSNIASVLANPSLAGIANIIAAFNPITALYNTAASIFKLPSIGKFVSSLFGSDTSPADPTSEAAQDAIRRAEIDERNATEDPAYEPPSDMIDQSDFTYVDQDLDELPASDISDMIDSQDSTNVSIEDTLAPTMDGEEDWVPEDTFEVMMGGDQGGGGGGSCVQVTSYTPTGTLAGNITVGDTMCLADSATLEADEGVVSFSKAMWVDGFRITSASGVTLVCSDTAPIPTQCHGLVKAPALDEFHKIAVKVGDATPVWEYVAKVESAGRIKVQHITVGNKCFWAGEYDGAYILHHNVKTSGDAYDSFLFDFDWSTT